MIPSAPTSGGFAIATIDLLLARNSARWGLREALFDHPEIGSAFGSPPRQMTWGELDRATGAVAQRLRDSGLSAGSIVALQMPNCVDAFIAIMACQRANLIAALFPECWRRAETSESLIRIGASGVIATDGQAAFEIAQDSLFEGEGAEEPLRLFAFGPDMPDNAISLEDCIDPPRSQAVMQFGRNAGAADRVAVITWDCNGNGYFPVERSHAELLAAAAITAAQGGDNNEPARFLTPLSPATFAGLATAFIPWLISGGTLVLHQPFDTVVLARQIDDHQIDHLVLPAAVAQAAVAEGVVDPLAMRSFIHLVRRPDLGAGTLAARDGVTHLFACGEVGLLPMIAEDDGSLVFSLDDAGSAVSVSLNHTSTLCLRGAHIPTQSYPEVVGISDYNDDDDRGWVSTGFPSRFGEETGAVTGPRPDFLTVGGYSAPLSVLEWLYSRVNAANAVNVHAVDSGLLGQRLLVTAIPGQEGGALPSDFADAALVRDISPLAFPIDVQIGERRAHQRIRVA